MPHVGRHSVVRRIGAVAVAAAAVVGAGSGGGASGAAINTGRITQVMVSSDVVPPDGFVYFATKAVFHADDDWAVTYSWNERKVQMSDEKCFADNAPPENADSPSCEYVLDWTRTVSIGVFRVAPGARGRFSIRVCAAKIAENARQFCEVRHFQIS
jgi:hypothetical protein